VEQAEPYLDALNEDMAALAKNPRLGYSLKALLAESDQEG
jgi:hypothetical protein